MDANRFLHHGTKHGWVLALHPPLPTFLWCLVFSIIILKGHIFSARFLRLSTEPTFFTPKLSNNFSFSFFLLLNNGDEFTRKRTETKSVSRREKILLPRESLIFSPEGLCTPREGTHRTNWKKVEWIPSAITQSIRAIYVVNSAKRL